MLNKELHKLNKHNQQWDAYHGEFDEKINGLLDDLEETRSILRPSFFFIDPFGYSGFDINTLKRILAHDRSELFINFMIYDIIRFIEADHSQGRMKQLFGSGDFSEVSEYTSSEKKQQFLVNLYCKQLKDYAGARYVMPFRINTPGMGKRPRYYLIHASNHIKALMEMKNNMAKVSDAPYRFEAIGITSQLGFFEDPDKTSLREMIRQHSKELSPSPVEYHELEEWAYANTNGVAKTIKEALMRLEDDGYIRIRRGERQRSTTVTKGATIMYRKTT
jgi:hypothetical protein